MVSTVTFFQELGATILARWAQCDYEPRRLSDIACDALHARPPARHVTYRDIIAETIAAETIAPQPNLTANFGQPPLTVFAHPRFYIEILFWTTSTTAVHQHGFSGAFSVLEGSSLQSQYTFDIQERVNEQAFIGKMTLRDVTLLKAGDVEPIRSGASLIHSVYHLDTPSVTVVIRTHSDQDSRPQYEYHYPYLAIDPFHEDPVRTRRIQMLDLLHRLKSPEYVSAAQRAIEVSELLGTFRILTAAKRHLREDADGFDALLQTSERRHGRLRSCALQAVLDEGERIEIIASRRQIIKNRDHRFLLALLLNLRDRDVILTAIETWYPRTDARALVLKWARELSGTKTIGIEFDDLTLFIFERLLDGADTPAVLRSLEEEYLPEQVNAQRDDLISHCNELKNSIVFKAILGPHNPL
jgi:hypothetical protein